LGVGYSQDIAYPLTGSLPEGDYVVTLAGATTSGGSEPLHIELVYKNQSLAAADTALDTTAPATTMVTLHATAITADCGDQLIFRVQHLATGSQPLSPFEISVDVP
jgi:hypothetical protein